MLLSSWVGVLHWKKETVRYLSRRWVKPTLQYIFLMKLSSEYTSSNFSNTKTLCMRVCKKRSYIYVGVKPLHLLPSQESEIQGGRQCLHLFTLEKAKPTRLYHTHTHIGQPAAAGDKENKERGSRTRSKRPRFHSTLAAWFIDGYIYTQSSSGDDSARGRNKASRSVGPNTQLKALYMRGDATNVEVIKVAWKILPRPVKQSTIINFVK
jgi:hypothetical protein